MTSKKLTYETFRLAGAHDAGNGFDPRDFEEEMAVSRASPKVAVEKVWREWEALEQRLGNGMKEQWISDNHDSFDDLDPGKCYEAWADGWRVWATTALQARRDRDLENEQFWYLAKLDKDDNVEAILERYESPALAEEAAIQAFKALRSKAPPIIHGTEMRRRIEEGAPDPNQLRGADGERVKFMVVPGDGRGPWRNWMKLGANKVEWHGNPSKPRVNPTQRALITNPAWVTKAISESYVNLESKIPPQWLPKLDDVKPAKGSLLTAKMKEYGCGAYGCVLPTLDPKVVLKITIDDTEADFAARLAETLVVPVACAYYKVVSLPAKRKNSRIYLLWREEAKKVDAIDKEPYGKAAVAAIGVQHRAAQAVYDLSGRGGKPGLSVALTKWEAACAAMAKVKQLKYLSDGMLKVYREQKIFFGDIHEGNVGLCLRGGVQEWVITDPGHVVVFGKEPSPHGKKPAKVSNPQPGDDWTYDGDDPDSAEDFSGHAAYEKQMAVRDVLGSIEPRIAMFMDDTVFGRMSPRGKAFIVETQHRGAKVVQARGAPHSAGAAGRYAELTAVFVVPWDIQTMTGNWETSVCSFEQTEKIFDAAIVELNKHWANPGWEWWWDRGASVILGPSPPHSARAEVAGAGIFEFSMGKKPWHWKRAPPSARNNIDFSEVRGYELATAEAERAVRTRQNMLLVSGGSGSTMIARRVPTIMPGSDWTQLPFRAPHHSISTTVLLEEARMARFGVLYLDEIHEFRVSSLRELGNLLATGFNGGAPMIVASSRPGERMSSRLTIPFPITVDPLAHVDPLTLNLRDLPTGRIAPRFAVGSTLRWGAGEVRQQLEVHGHRGRARGRGVRRPRRLAPFRSRGRR